jgi:M-phase inducer tyrosine phosphatase
MAEADIDPPSLEYFSQCYRRITADTFCSFFDSRPGFDSMLVIDCRSAPEYEGGHIKGAIRRHPFEAGFDALYSEVYSPTTLFIFHCEYSFLRGPVSIARFIQQHMEAGRDRATLHAFVLDGGYREFWPAHREYCEGGYVPEGFD